MGLKFDFLDFSENFEVKGQMTKTFVPNNACDVPTGTFVGRTALAPMQGNTFEEMRGEESETVESNKAIQVIYINSEGRREEGRGRRKEGGGRREEGRGRRRKEEGGGRKEGRNLLKKCVK